MANKKKQTDDDEAVAKKNCVLVQMAIFITKQVICPVCFVFEKTRKSTKDFLSLLAVPAIRALESKKYILCNNYLNIVRKRFYNCMEWGHLQYQNLKLLYKPRGCHLKMTCKDCYH
jgi:hypothetical protein